MVSFVLVHPKSTKAQIISLLKTSEGLSITEIAAELNITDMAVRRHIHSLELDNLITSVTNRQTKGRPSKLYQLSKEGEELFPKKYKQLSIEILQELKAVGQESLINDLFLKRKKRLVEKYEFETAGKSFNEKLEVLKSIQEAEGFMPEITVENGVVHFREYNCPYVETAKEFGQICASEKEFLKELLQTDTVKIQSCMASGSSCCHYVISPY
ncbi:HTH domain-containing protein [Bacillus sp. Bva_UNVM-123]